MQSNTFLESDFLSSVPTVIFGINHVVSAPTIAHIKEINHSYQSFIDAGCEQVWCVSFGNFEMFDFLMPKFSNKVKFLQTDQVLFFKDLFAKRGHIDFLRNYWQFAGIVKNGQVQHYIEQPFMGPIPIDTAENIYSAVAPNLLLAELNKY